MKSRAASKTRHIAITAALLCTVTISAHANTITVTNTSDSGPGSLRQALVDANDGDTIIFDPSLNSQAIRLVGPELVIDSNVTISGPGPELLAVCRGSNECFMMFDSNWAASQVACEYWTEPQGVSFRVFHVMPGHVANIAGLTISYGHDTGGGIFNDQSSLTVDGCTVWANFDNSTGGGGGIRNTGASANLTILNSMIASNISDGGAGGGIYNADGMIMLVNSTVSDNYSPSLPILEGGGVSNSGQMQISSSIIDGNTAGDSGGGIVNNGYLVINDSMVTNNHAGTNFEGSGFGGGISNRGTMEITNSWISLNDATGKNGGSGGGIASNGPLDINNSTVSGNFANLTAGGIANGGTLTITNTTISDNSASESAGGAANTNTLIIANSTVSGNVVNLDAGGIANGGTLMIAKVTFSNNRANGAGGGVYNDAAGTVELRNTILNAGASGANIFNSGGTVTSHGYNVSSDDAGGFLTGPGDQTNTDPLLGILQDNCGPTFTHALLPGSPAIDAGDPNFTPPPFYDQRGTPFVRVFNGRIDIGSFEVQPTPTPTPTPTATSTPTATPTATPIGRPTPTARPHPTPHPRP